MKLKDFDSTKDLSKEYVPKSGSLFNRPDYDKEKFYIVKKVSPNLSLDQIKGIIKRFKDKFKRKGYIVLEKWEDVINVFGDNYLSRQDDFEEGTAAFVVWKYSAFLNLIPENLKKRDEILEKISSTDAMIIMGTAGEEGLLEKCYHFDPYVNKNGKRRVYLSNTLEMTVKRKKNGKGYYNEQSNGKTVPVFRKLTPFDLSLPVIEKIIKKHKISLKDVKS